MSDEREGMEGEKRRFSEGFQGRGQWVAGNGRGGD
jgi:hypothetical protein